ncbi:BMP family lipoprotein [Spelaeicoccus albus]|uniref:Basic membrane protein A n=1 Tax=Spelaeicoccus albus TaxID=1280376 RepID=A0A7Z0IJC5_9MICO|nr:BMP family ABC transporter substrate-binding protein [Spelaeicoccus albus]NYI69276.1 basic membrane protein A [Spelaeicoccus albus]
MKKQVRAVAILASVAMMLTACGEAPDKSSGKEAGGGNDFLGCMVSDSGGFNDQSFNQAGYDGLMQSKKDGIVTKTKTAESNSEADFTPNVTQMVNQGCDLTVTVGYLLASATEKAAKANPKSKFALIDTTLKTPLKNVKPIEFDTVQAAFLGGYLAAAESKTGTVGTFGGQKIPSVTIYMDGFVKGVNYYNKAKHKNVKTIGWNVKKQDGTFTGDFTDASKGKTVTKNLISQGADVILPVAGPVGAGAAAAALAHKGTHLMWVDSDGYKSLDKKYRPLLITSVEKQIGNSVESVLKATANGKFSNEPYVGTLKNGGVGLAPYHDWSSKISSETKSEIKSLTKKIEDGSLKVTSPSTPKS